MPHMLRIAVESVRDDDGRGVSASRSASQCTVPTAFPSSLLSSSLYLSRQRSFAPDASSFSPVGRTCCSYRSFVRAPAVRRLYEMEQERTGGARGSRRCEHKCLCFVSLDNVRYRHSLEFRVVSCSSSSPDAF